MELSQINVLQMLLLAIGFILAIDSIVIIKENENAVRVLLGRPIDVVGSGLHFKMPVIERFIRYETRMQQVELTSKDEPVKIVTAEGYDVYGRVRTESERGRRHRRAGNGAGQNEKARKVHPARIEAQLTFYFFWPTSKELLMRTIKIFPNPNNNKEIRDVLAEPILEAARVQASKMVWTKFYREQSEFAAEVVQNLMDQPSDPIRRAKLQSPKVVITRIVFPDKDLEETITKPEIAERKREETITKAEGEKRRLVLEGEGKAAARKALFEAIGDKLTDIQKETLLRFSEMAQGTSNTLWITMPSYVYETIAKTISGEGPIDIDSLHKLLKDHGLDIDKNKLFDLFKKK